MLTRPFRTGEGRGGLWIPLLLSALSLLLLHSSPAAYAQTGYLVVDLGTLGAGGTVSEAHGINKKGQVVGSAHTGAFITPTWSSVPWPVAHAFVWDADTGMTDLDNFGTDNINGDIARAINAAGQVVGQAWGGFPYTFVDDLGDTNTVTLSAVHGFLWTKGGTDGFPTNPQMKDLGALVPGYWDRGPPPTFDIYIGFSSYATAINDAGVAAGNGEVGSAATGIGYAGFVSTVGGTLQNLGGLAGSVSSAISALDINNAGWIVGDTTIYDPLYPHDNGYHRLSVLVRPLDTDSNGTPDTWFRDADSDGDNDLMISLGALPGGVQGYAAAVNDGGQVVGFAETAFNQGLAFVWKDANANGASDPGEMVGLGKLAGDTGSYAQDINNHGDVVGISFDDSNPSAYVEHPFLYRPAEDKNGNSVLDAGEDRDGDGTLDPAQMLPLQDLLPADSGWTLTFAAAINDNGEIAGTGIKGGQTRAFLLKPITGVTPAGETVTVTPPSTVPVTLTFDTITGAGGTTTVTTTQTAPPLPPDFQVSGTFIDISTTAAFTGPVEVCVPYNPAVFPYNPDGATEALQWPQGKPQLLHYNSGIGWWEDVTTAVNPQNQLVCGTTTNLSPFVVAKQVTGAYTVEALYDQTKVHKLGSTVPLKVRVLFDGANVSSPDLRLLATGWAFVDGDAQGVPEDAGNANPDSNFRYDAALSGYIYNLSTKGLPQTGTYRLSLTVGGGGNATGLSVQFKVK